MSEVDPIQKSTHIDEFLTRGVQEILPSPDLLRKELESGRVLKGYIGVDPTAPDLHIGHASQLQKLRRLQELGHKSILLIGDFTGMIGDPTDKSATRVRLTRDEVLNNARTYRDQAGKIVNFDDPINPVEIRFNSEWLSQMNFADVVELASEMTVQRMAERETFRRRMRDKKPLYVHEFLYPLMQGRDSVVLDVDIEIGGSDQIFNMMVGRDMVGRHLGKEKYVIAGKLLVDPTGKKIGKSEGNMITLSDEPASMYHKVMMWGDAIVPHALELCTTLPMSDIGTLERQLQIGEIDPIEAKMFLARRVVEDLHSPEAAIQAESAYKQISTRGSVEGFIEEIRFNSQISLIDALVSSGLANSKSAARRLIQQRGVRINGETVNDPKLSLDPSDEGYELQVGKLKAESFRKVMFD